jgi:flavin-dependent thymidylate synthase
VEPSEETVQPGKTVARWADRAMYEAAAMPKEALDGPAVHLIWMTPDPLGAAAALNGIYTGKVKRSLSDVTRAEREALLEDQKLTALKSPLEVIQLHFLIEGVTRGFTHQLVRHRLATYGQESTRFAVFGQEQNIPVALPPSLAGTMSVEEWYDADSSWRMKNTSQEQEARLAWEHAVETIQVSYGEMVERGMPAEDARGILPTNLKTRIHMSTDLRNLFGMSGVRLCTQAQFEWRQVFSQIAKAIRNYDPYEGLKSMFAEDMRKHMKWDVVRGMEVTADYLASHDRWQYEAIADLFRPICYNTGKCEFMSAADRACSIRERVQANHEIGRPSSEWHTEADLGIVSPSDREPPPWGRVSDGHAVIPPISPAEWLTDPTAARRG